MENNAQLQQYRSVVQTHAKPTVSDKYTFIPTTRVIDILDNMGWYPVKAQEGRTKGENAGYQKHMVRFRQKNVGSIMVKDTVFPEVVVVNSHGGASSFILFSGLFRLVCLNGMVVGDANFGAYRVKHLGFADIQVREAVEQVSSHLGIVGGRVKDFQQIDLTRNEQGVFAMASLLVKYGEEEMERRQFDPELLLQPKRYEDRPPTLWNTYNTVQEKLIKGDRFEINRGTHRAVKSRPLSSVSEDVRINQGLWYLAEHLANSKGSTANQPVHNA